MLSVRRLLKVADVAYRAIEKCSDAGVFALLAANATQFLLKSISLSGIPLVLLQTAVCAGALCRFAVPVFKAVHVSYGQKANR